MHICNHIGRWLEEAFTRAEGACLANAMWVVQNMVFAGQALQLSMLKNKLDSAWHWYAKAVMFLALPPSIHILALLCKLC